MSYSILMTCRQNYLFLKWNVYIKWNIDRLIGNYLS